MSARESLGLPAGFMVGRYKLEKIEAEWGFYLSYRAQDTSDGRAVVLHELLPEELVTRAADGAVSGKSEPAEESLAWARECFLREGRALMGCAHPALQEILEVFEANGTAYWVTPRGDARSFKDWLHNLGRSPNETELRHFLEPLLSALQQLHAAGLYHLNLKPDSIQITASGRPLLQHFGGARQGIARHCFEAAAVTTGYSAPEQYDLEKKEGAWSDIYSLAAVLYRAITGQSPPDAEQRLTKDPYQPLARRFVGQYPENFLAALDAALAVDPGGRPPTVRDWRRRLGLRAEGYLPANVFKHGRFALAGVGFLALLLVSWLFFHPSPTPTATPTPTSTPSPTPQSTPASQSTPTTPASTPNITPIPTLSPTPRSSPTPVLSPASTPTPSHAPALTPTPALMRSATPKPVVSPAPSPSPTPVSLSPTPVSANSPQHQQSPTEEKTRTLAEKKEKAREERLAAEQEAAARAEMEKQAKMEAARAAEEAKKAEEKAEAAKRAAKEAAQQAESHKAAAAEKEAATAKAEAEKAALSKETAKVGAALAGVQRAASEEIAASKALNEKNAAEEIAAAASQAAAENKQSESVLAETKIAENAAAAERLAAQKKTAEKSVATASAKEEFAKATADLKTLQARLAAEKTAEAETVDKQLANRTAGSKTDAEEARRKASEARSAAESAAQEKTKADQFVAEMAAETKAVEKRSEAEIAEAEKAAAEKAAKDKRMAQIAKEKAEKAAAENIAGEKAAREKREMAEQKAAAEKAAADKAAAEKAAQAANDPNAGKYKQSQASPEPSQAPVTTNRQGSTGTAMAGIWETTSTNAHGKPKRRLIIYNDGRYEISDSEGWKDTGAIIAQMGRIQMLSDATKVVVRSSFKLRTLSKIVTAGALGDEEWQRVQASPGDDPKNALKK